MLILIAESKTMSPQRPIVADDNYQAHTPLLNAEADRIMSSLEDMSADELSKAAKFTPSMASKLYGMIQTFGDKSRGIRAIDAFTGVVFKALDFSSLDPAARSRALADLRIISSVYGWLRPDDIIKPYRLDYTSPLAPDGRQLAAWLRPAVTRALIEEIDRGGHTEILDLLPADASREIDWSEVTTRARRLQVNFRQITDGQRVRSPHATRLKTLRGTLLRDILTRGITDSAALAAMSSPQYMPSPDEPKQSSPGTITITFLTA